MVQELKPFPENQAINIEHTLLLRNAIHSTGIEGNQISDIDDASRIVLGDAPKQPYPLQDMNEIYDHYYNEREHNKQRKFIPNRDDVQFIHKNIVFRSLHFSHHGVWRHGSQLVHIKGAKIMLPLSEEVPELMNRYFEYLPEIDNTNDPVVFACLAHADFIRIHPFADGNGRTGRILMNSILQARGYPAVVIPRTEKELYKQMLNDHFELQKNGGFANPIESPFCNYLENKLQDSINTLINMV
jgi:Fic family protein